MKSIFQVFALLGFAFSTYAAAPDISGKWKWIYERNGEPINIEMTLKEEGTRLSGKVVAPENRVMEIHDGKISDDGAVTFYINLERDSGPLRIDFIAKATDGKLAGKTVYTTDQGEKRERDWNPRRDTARDLSGKWLSTFKRSDGTPMETTFELKQSGDKLSGKQSINDSETEIREGKIQGDDVTFKTLRERDGRTVTSTFRGKIQKDNSIKGDIESDWTGEVRHLEWEAHKAR